MTCGGCVKSVTNAVKEIDPNASVEVNLTEQIVKIESNKDKNIFMNTIKEAGFDIITSA